MSLPPIINSPVFNSSYFNSSNGYLTLTTGDQRYLRLGGVGTLSALNVIGNMNCGSLTLNGSSLDLSGLDYLSGVTPGAASASKAVSLTYQLQVLLGLFKPQHSQISRLLGI